MLKTRIRIKTFLCMLAVFLMISSVRVKASEFSDANAWKSVSVSHEWSPGEGKKEVRYIAGQRNMELILLTDGFQDYYSMAGGKSHATWCVSFQDGINEYKLQCRTPDTMAGNYTMEDMNYQVLIKTSSDLGLSSWVGYPCSHSIQGNELKWSVTLPDICDDLDIEHIKINSYNIQEYQDLEAPQINIDWTIEADGTLVVRDAEKNHSLQEIYLQRDYIKKLDIDVSTLVIYRDMFANFENLEMVKLKADHLVGNDLSGFLKNCKKLREVDLSSLSATNVAFMIGAFKNCSHLEKIKTPLYLRANCFLNIGEGNWQTEETNEVMAMLPKDADHSMTLVRGKQTVFSLAGTSMVLGDSLDMLFLINQVDITETDYYATIRKVNVGKDDTVKTLQFSEWYTYGPYYLLQYDKLTAMEMNDKFYVQVFHADGTPASECYEDSVADYALRGFDELSEAEKRLSADLLFYGAAAQKTFGYDMEHLVSDRMTDAQKAYGTVSVSGENKREDKAYPHYAGTSLDLQSRIQFYMFFNEIPRDGYAEISFTNHNGEKVYYTVAGNDYLVANDIRSVIVVDKLTIPDARKLVTCEVYDKDGNLLDSVTDSIESYVFRGVMEEIDEAVLKFADSAYQYFHP